MLCTMVWIFETMKADQPYLCRPFATCCRVKQHEIDPEVARRNYQEGFCVWNHLEKQFEVNMLAVQVDNCTLLKYVKHMIF